MVIVLSDTEVAKLYTDDTRSDIGSEAEKMQFANAVNDLVARFIWLGYNDVKHAKAQRAPAKYVPGGGSFLPNL